MTSIYFKSTCQDFLSAAREGNVENAEKALEEVPRAKWNHVVNLPGDSKTNRSWSALQLSTYFGHLDMVNFLISHGADVNYQNDASNTALHLAAFTKRCEIVLSLLAAGAHVHIVNSEGKLPKKMADKDDEVFKIIQQAEKCFMIEQQEKLFRAVRMNSTDDIIDVLNGECPPSINCKDLNGNTPLHIAANLNKHAAAVILLQNGACTSALNNADLKPVDLTMRSSMKRLLSLKPVQSVLKDVQRFEGEILKKGLFLVKRFWVVISRGIVTFYNRKDDSISGVNKKGYLFLRGATVKPDASSVNLLQLKLADRSQQYWSISSGVDKTADVALRQKWMTALQIHIDYASRVYHKITELDSPYNKGARARFNWGIGTNLNIQPISSVRDSLLSAQTFVRMLSTQVSEVVTSAETLEAETLKKETSQYTPVMIPEMQRLVDSDMSMPDSVSSLRDAPVSGSGAPLRFSGNNNKLTAHHMTMIRQLMDVSELSKKVMANLEQCMMVMFQQEEYRLEQLNEANRKNEILENALRILAKQQYNLEVTLNESFRSVDSNIINKFEQAVSKMNVHQEGVNNSVKTFTDDEDDDMFYDALSVDSGGSICSTSEFALIETARISPETCEINGHLNNNTAVEVLLNNAENRSSSPKFLNSLQTSVGADFAHETTLSSLFSQESLSFEHDSAARFMQCLINGGRQALPVEMPTGRLLSLWETLKELLGKDLTRVSMPVLFNEPLSMLQRSAEFIESVFLLAKASNVTDDVTRMVLSSTFVIVCLHSLADRLNKPFNPLLGETFQLIDEKLGYRFVAEQVSHHPPISALSFQSSFCDLNTNSAPIISFGGLGQSIQVRVAGNSVLRLKIRERETEEVLSWTHPKYIVHNIIAGQLWLEQSGLVTVWNHSNGCSVDIEFKTAGFFKGSLHDVEAYVKDPNGIKRFYLFGKWNESIYSIPVEKMAKHMDEKRRSDTLIDCLIADPDCVQVWARLSHGDTSKYYNFTRLAFLLNEMPSSEDDPENLCPKLPKTDSRFRPDMRHLEKGELSKASEEKHRLEQKQRASRAARERSQQAWKPLWFEDNHFEDDLKQGSTSVFQKDVMPSQRFVFNNKYWTSDFSSCPDIF